MIPILDHIFNSLYRFHKRINLVDPEYKSLLAIVSFEWCLMLFLMQVFDLLPRDFNKALWIVVFLILLAINYLLFLKRNRYKVIERLLNKKQKKAIRQLFDFLTISLLVFSILVAIGFFLNRF